MSQQQALKDCIGIDLGRRVSVDYMIERAREAGVKTD